MFYPSETKKRQDSTYKGRRKQRINMDYFNHVGCFFFPLVYDKNNSMQLTNKATGVGRKQRNDLKHLGTVAGERKRSYYH